MLHVSSCVLVLCVVVSRSQYITASTSNATATATNTGVGVRAELDEIVVEMREANVNDLYLHYYFIRSCDPSIRKPIGRFKKQLKNGKVSLTILDRCLVYQVCGCWNSEVGEVVGTSRKQCSERERQCNDSVHVDISDIYKPDRPTFVSQSVTEKSVSVVCQPEVNSQVEWLMDRNSYRFEAEIGCAEAETEAEAEAGVGNETRMRAEGERCNIETEEDEDEDEADAGKSKSGIRRDGNQLQQQQQQRRQREQVSNQCNFKFDRLKANRTYVLRIRAVQGNGSVKSDALEVGIKTDGETRRKPGPGSANSIGHSADGSGAMESSRPTPDRPGISNGSSSVENETNGAPGGFDWKQLTGVVVLIAVAVVVVVVVVVVFLLVYCVQRCRKRRNNLHQKDRTSATRPPHRSFGNSTGYYASDITYQSPNNHQTIDFAQLNFLDG